MTLDLVGMRFDKLRVLRQIRITPSGSEWACECVCGNLTAKITTQLRRIQKRNGFIGCKSCERKSRSDAATQHGGCKYGKSRLYRIWRGMRDRCRTPGATSWKYYGAKGIRVCGDWQNFEVFRRWALSHGYQSHLTIDRLNPSADYSPENCEWVTASENSRRAMVQRHQKLKETA